MPGHDASVAARAFSPFSDASSLEARPTPVRVLGSTLVTRARPRLETCDRARIARDPRFDGLFFTGVLTTRIYCRPTCPVRPAKSRNVVFFPIRCRRRARRLPPLLALSPGERTGHARPGAEPRRRCRAPSAHRARIPGRRQDGRGPRGDAGHDGPTSAPTVRRRGRLADGGGHDPARARAKPSSTTRRCRCPRSRSPRGLPLRRFTPRFARLHGEPRQDVAGHQLHRAEHPLVGQSSEVGDGEKVREAGRLVAARDPEDLVGIANGDHVLLDEALERPLHGVETGPHVAIHVRSRLLARRLGGLRAIRVKAERRGGVLETPPGRRERGAIVPQAARHLGQRLRRRVRDEHGGKASRADARSAVGAQRGDPDGRPGLLQRPHVELHVLDAMVAGLPTRRARPSTRAGGSRAPRRTARASPRDRPRILRTRGRGSPIPHRDSSRPPERTSTMA